MKDAGIIIAFFVATFLGIGYGSFYVLGGIESGMHNGNARHHSVQRQENPGGSVFGWKKNKKRYNR